jgi:hypothetical protein
MPPGGEIHLPGRQGPEAMQAIGQNNDGLDGKWSASTGRLAPFPKVVNVFGQEVPAAFQQLTVKYFLDNNRDKRQHGAKGEV